MDHVEDIFTCKYDISFANSHQQMQDDHRQKINNNNNNKCSSITRKGVWSPEEDSILVRYISIHGEGRWDTLAQASGLKRSGKSCRLRWLNYLRPNVRRGNFTLEEQLLILHLHCFYGNRWSRIAKFLDGRTDNEIKNYWRTRVQKQAKHLNCEVNSEEFSDFVRYLWIPTLAQQCRAQYDASSSVHHDHPLIVESVVNSSPEALSTHHSGPDCWSGSSENVFAMPKGTTNLASSMSSSIWADSLEMDFDKGYWDTSPLIMDGSFSLEMDTTGSWPSF